LDRRVACSTVRVEHKRNARLHLAQFVLWVADPEDEGGRHGHLHVGHCIRRRQGSWFVSFDGVQFLAKSRASLAVLRAERPHNLVPRGLDLVLGILGKFGLRGVSLRFRNIESAAKPVATRSLRLEIQATTST